MSLPAPTVTGYSGFWEQHAPAGQGGPYAIYGNRYHLEQQLARALGKTGFRGHRRILYALLGQATGNAAAETYKRISAPAGITEASAHGGARVIDTITVINRNTTAADLTYAQALLNRVYNQAPTSYPVDPSRNTGGGKAGY